MTDPAITSEICRRLAGGESLVAITRDPDMPAQSTVYLWLQQDEQFRKDYAEAREFQADTLADEILDISDDGRNDWIERERQDGTTERVIDHEHVQRSRLRVDSRKWLAGKLKPKKYGDATLIKHADADGNTRALDDVERFTRMASIFAEIKEATGDTE